MSPHWATMPAPDRSPALGVLAAVAALASWTLFGLGNARFLAAHPEIAPTTWASLLGVAGLAFTLPVTAVLLLTQPVTATHRPGAFLVGVLALGILTSWVATAAWNRAAVELPVSVAGQLVVIETIAGTTYSYLYHRAWPELTVVGGLVLLLAGVTLAVRRTSADVPEPGRVAGPPPERRHGRSASPRR
jgi:drug/metabolite transporter (DMT)-like permease